MIPMIDMAAAGRNITNIIRDEGYSAASLAELLGVSRSNVYKWMRGEVLPSIDNLYAMSCIFGMTINEILAG